MKLFIYLIENTINGKKYIGQTNNFDSRMRAHKAARDKNTLICRSVSKYGWDNHKVSILFNSDVASRNVADMIESYFIRYYNTFFTLNKNGLNMTEGNYPNKISSSQRRRNYNTIAVRWMAKHEIKSIVVLNKKFEIIDEAEQGINVNDFLFKYVKRKENVDNVKRQLVTKGWQKSGGLLFGVKERNPQALYQQFMVEHRNRNVGIVNVKTVAMLNRYRDEKQVVPVLDLNTGFFFETTSDFCKQEGICHASVLERFARGKYEGRYKLCRD